MRRRDLLLFATAAFVHVACGSSTEGGPADPDGGAPTDGGAPPTTDGGTKDAGVDAGAPLPPTSAAADSHARFPQGLASGDPRPDRVVLWTRVEPKSGESGDFTVGYVIATDEALTQIVARGEAPAKADADSTLRLIPTGLSPATTYFYRFHVTTPSGSITTQVARARTAPTADAAVNVSFCFASCQDYIGRYYHSWQMLLDENPTLDFVLWLGDYIYESVNDSRFQADAGARGIRLPDGMDASPNGDGSKTVAKTLADYRFLYKTLRSDENLREIHRRYTFVTLWDDHEFADDCWQDHSTYFNEKDPSGAFTDEKNTPRRVGANRAFFEFQPVDVSYQANAPFPDDITIYRSFQYGKHLDLFATDQRMYRSDHVVAEGPTDLLVGKFTKNSSVGSRYFVFKNGFDNAEASKKPTLLGAPQKAWLLDAVKKSKATWKLWANEVQMWQQVIDLSQIQGVPSFLKTKFYVNCDQWDGYRGERKEILSAFAAAGVENLVVCTGDIHAFFAAELHPNFDAPGAKPVGVEFVTAGISSASLKALVANLTASAPYLAPIVNYVVDDADNTLKASNAHLRYSQANANGLSLVTVSATEVNVTFLALAGDVLKPDYAGIASRQQFRTRVGTNKIEVL